MKSRVIASIGIMSKYKIVISLQLKTVVLMNFFLFQKAAAVHLQRHCNTSRAEKIYMDWIWWILQGLPFPHLVRVMDCFFHEGIKVSVFLDVDLASGGPQDFNLAVEG